MDVLKQHWEFALVGVAFIAWLLRLEARGLANEKEIKRLWTQRKEDLATAQKSRDEQSAMLTEIRQDVKALLGARSGKS